jgi:hypothetical protein
MEAWEGKVPTTPPTLMQANQKLMPIPNKYPVTLSSVKK